MEIHKVRKLSDNRIKIDYSVENTHSCIIISPEHIIANYNAAQQSFAADGAVCTCKLPGFSAKNPANCRKCGKPHRR